MTTEYKVLGVIVHSVIYRDPRKIDICLWNIEIRKMFRPEYQNMNILVSLKHSTSIPENSLIQLLPRFINYSVL